MIKIKSVYTLIKSDIPEIKGKNIISDVRVGGEKLVYKRVVYQVKIYKFFKYEICIPLVFRRKKSGGICLDINISTIAFLRPYKKNWAAKRKTVRNLEPFHLWGKKDHPLTNIWVELEYDYQDIMKSMPLIKARVEDEDLITFLRQHEEKFQILSNQNPSKSKEDE